MDAPQVMVIAGPNGAGKSTLAPTLLGPRVGVDIYVNADVIAQGLGGDQQPDDQVALQAGRLMLRRLKQLAADRQSFAFETTLASRSFAPWLTELREAGYRVAIIYLWLPSSDVAIERVSDRVAMGGHAIPEDVIRRRYRGGLTNLGELYWKVADEVVIYQNAEPGGVRLVAHRDGSGSLKVYDAAAWAAIALETPSD